jgi:hypothetical protein
LRAAMTPPRLSTASPTIARDDKADPLYYARHTVEKAQRQFAAENSPNHPRESLQRNSASPAEHEIQDRS